MSASHKQSISFLLNTHSTDYKARASYPDPAPSVPTFPQLPAIQTFASHPPTSSSPTNIMHLPFAFPSPPSPPKKSRFSCSLCPRSFSEKGNLNKHKRSIHEGLRPHACGSCGRTFSFADGLKRHVQMRHLNSRPWECRHCPCPPLVSAATGHDCGRVCRQRFKTKSHRVRHQSVHRRQCAPGRRRAPAPAVAQGLRFELTADADADAESEEPVYARSAPVRQGAGW